MNGTELLNACKKDVSRFRVFSDTLSDVVPATLILLHRDEDSRLLAPASIG
jgi:hypothetical protein